MDDRNFCFEIFGYDYIIDEQFKVWLIEINTNPCIEESSKILRVLLPRMIDDALRMTLDIIFPRKKKKEFNEFSQVIDYSPYPVENYPDNENMWEYLTQIGIVRAPTNYKAATSSLFKQTAKLGTISTVTQINPPELEDKNKDINSQKT